MVFGRWSVGALLVVTVLAWGCSDDSGDSAGDGASNGASNSVSNGEADTGTGDEDAAVGSDTGGSDTGGAGDVGVEPDAADDTGGEVEWPAVDEPGPYNVGFRELTTTYTTIDDEERSLRTVIWYPTEDTEGTPAVYGGLLPQEGIFGDASLAAPTVDGSYPLMVFSHGNGGFAEQSYFMTEFFTSHGWVVVAMDHTGNTFNDMSASESIIYLRPLDVSAVLDTILELPGEDPLGGASLDPIITSGHSFGGYTVLTVAGAGFQIDALFGLCDNGAIEESNCAPYREPAREAQLRAGFLDPRIDLAIPMSPGATQLLGAGIGDITVPTLLFTSELDATTSNTQDGDPTWSSLDAPGALRVNFMTGGHFTFSNACNLGAGLGEGDGCGEGFIDFEVAHDVINTYSLAFARFHLFEDVGVEGILNGDVELSADVELLSKP